MSGGNRVLRELNEGSAEISNTFWEFITDVEVTQTRAIFGEAVSMEAVVSPVSEMENKYSSALLRLKGYISANSKIITPTPTKTASLKASNDGHHAISSDFTSYGFTFLK